MHKVDSSHMKEQVAGAADLIRRAGKVVALTGAGVSTESGIPDFRSRDGLWSRFDPMEYGTLGAFRRDPAKVWTMLEELLAVIAAEPNPGHLAMAAMEKAGLLRGIITQNIDGLHQKAGSREVVEFHGSMARFSCPACGETFSAAGVLRGKKPPVCRCGEILKPDIVFFDETIPPAALERTEEFLSEADILLVAGTSCQVAPASSIPVLVSRQGGKIIEINSEPVLEHLAAVSIAHKFAGTMRRLAEALGI